MVSLKGFQKNQTMLESQMANTIKLEGMSSPGGIAFFDAKNIRWKVFF